MMTDMEFLQILSGIDENLLEQADKPVPFRQKRGFKIALIAAVLAFALLITPIAGAFALAMGYFLSQDNIKNPNEPQAPTQDNVQQDVRPGGLVGKLFEGIDWGGLKEAIGNDGNVNWEGFFAALQGKPTETIGEGGHVFESVKLSDGTVKITKFFNNGNETIVHVPETILGAKVSVIGAWSFAENQNITHVSLPDTVTVIEDSAFHSCTNLVTVDYPDHLVKIGDYAFAACNSLTNCDLPCTLQTLGSFAFLNTDITSVTIPASLDSWGEYSFEACLDLQTLIIEDGTKAIPVGAFRGAEIQELVIPTSVTSIGDFAFTNCNHLQSIDLPEGLKEIGHDAFAGTAITTMTIPSTVTTMGDVLFSGCEGLESVVFAGNAPEVSYFESSTGLEPNTAYKIYHLLGADGFSASEWNGHSCELMQVQTEQYVLKHFKRKRYTEVPMYNVEVLGSLSLSGLDEVTVLDSYKEYEAFSHVLTSARYDRDYFKQSAIVLIKVTHTSSEKILGLAGMGAQLYTTGGIYYLELCPVVKIDVSENTQTYDKQYTYILAEVQRSDIRTDNVTRVGSVYAYDIHTQSFSEYHPGLDIDMGK